MTLFGEHAGVLHEAISNDGPRGMTVLDRIPLTERLGTYNVLLYASNLPSVIELLTRLIKSVHPGAAF